MTEKEPAILDTVRKMRKQGRTLNEIGAMNRNGKPFAIPVKGAHLKASREWL